MPKRSSLKAKTTFLSIFLFIILIALGGVSIIKINDVNKASAEIREHWLPSTRILGDLTNYTSDFRAAESSALLVNDPNLLSNTETELKQLSKLVKLAQENYQKLNHTSDEIELYEQFSDKWESYREVAQDVITHIQANQRVLANEIHLGPSKVAYAKVSDALSKLSIQTVKATSEANQFAAAVYSQSQKLIFLAVLFSVTCIGLTLAYIRRFISLPILSLASSMRELASNSIDVKVTNINRLDEIGEMARAVQVFKENAVALAHSRKLLEDQASYLERQLATEKRLTELQRNFISMVSHEFRTPLTIIDGQAQRILKVNTGTDNHDLNDRARKIRDAVVRITKVMGSLLNSTKVYHSEDKPPFEFYTFDINQMLKDVCQHQKELAPNINIELSFSPETVILSGNQELLFLAFSNLISNAIKYSKDIVKISIESKIENQVLKITISDEGIGIPEKDLKNIFERYQRGSNATSREGSGIGLFFVKNIIELHHGSIAVKSTENIGSNFTIELPIIDMTLG